MYDSWFSRCISWEPIINIIVSYLESTSGWNQRRQFHDQSASDNPYCLFFIFECEGNCQLKNVFISRRNVRPVVNRNCQWVNFVNSKFCSPNFLFVFQGKFMTLKASSLSFLIKFVDTLSILQSINI